jgi:hypothetical protein
MARFRRTKDEIARGLSPEQAMAERARSTVSPTETPSKKNKKGDITIHIRASKGVDPDYFEFVTDRVIEVEQDEHFYKWVDHLASKVYDEHGQAKLFTDILSNGIGKVLTTRQFTKDIK